MNPRVRAAALALPVAVLAGCAPGQVHDRCRVDPLIVASFSGSAAGLSHIISRSVACNITTNIMEGAKQ